MKYISKCFFLFSTIIIIIIIIIFSNFKLWIATAIHNFKLLKMYMQINSAISSGRFYVVSYSLSSQGAADSITPSLAEDTMESGRGRECLTMAPYNPYSAIMLPRPQVFSVFRHFARLFWNHTWRRQKLEISHVRI